MKKEYSVRFKFDSNQDLGNLLYLLPTKYAHTYHNLFEEEHEY